MCKSTKIMKPKLTLSEGICVNHTPLVELMFHFVHYLTYYILLRTGYYLNNLITYLQRYCINYNI